MNHTTVQITEPVIFNKRSGKPRRKIRLMRQGICLGSVWLGSEQDLGDKLGELLNKVGATISVRPKPVISSLPVWLL